jgi:SAM-dependent methyltransferase
LHLIQNLGWHLVGLDISQSGVRNANRLAVTRDLSSQARFEECGFSKKLRFDASAFDAVFSNDVLCHLSGRSEVLGEVFRVPKPGGRMLFSDALVVGGMLSYEEIATRSSLGFYVYSPPGENERLIENAGFRHVRVPTQLKARFGLRSGGMLHGREGKRAWLWWKARATSRNCSDFFIAYMFYRPKGVCCGICTLRVRDRKVNSRILLNDYRRVRDNLLRSTDGPSSA